MKATELIEKLQVLIREHGDLSVTVPIERHDLVSTYPVESVEKDRSEILLKTRLTSQ